MQPSFAGDAAFPNDGSLVNDGSITGNGTEWVQSGGSVSGNEVVLQNGSTLVDSAGSGTFLGNYGTLVLPGTIPAGQTVIGGGEPFNYGGETYNTTGLSNAGTELVNDGTLVLNPTGSGETGGSINVEPGSIHNNGVIDVETETAARVTQLQESLTNGPSGQLEINGGIFEGNSGAPVTNEGLVTLAPGAVLQLQEASAFVNHGTGPASSPPAARSLRSSSVGSPLPPTRSSTSSRSTAGSSKARSRPSSTASPATTRTSHPKPHSSASSTGGPPAGAVVAAAGTQARRRSRPSHT